MTTQGEQFQNPGLINEVNTAILGICLWSWEQRKKIRFIEIEVCKYI